jgi:hypothetical protein
MILAQWVIDLAAFRVPDPAAFHVPSMLYTSMGSDNKVRGSFIF